MWQAFIPVATSAFSAFGKIFAGNAAAEAGRAQRASMQYEADQARVNAGQAIAVAQRNAMEQRRQGALVQSRALALAAAGGGSTTDPGIINLIAGNAGEIAYRSAVALYEGEDKARSLEALAKGREYSGAMAEKSGNDRKKAAMIGAFGDLLQGGSSLYQALNPGGSSGGGAFDRLTTGNSGSGD